MLVAMANNITKLYHAPAGHRAGLPGFCQRLHHAVVSRSSGVPAGRAPTMRRQSARDGTPAKSAATGVRTGSVTATSSSPAAKVRVTRKAPASGAA
jgi:hypothetical protein